MPLTDAARCQCKHPLIESIVEALRRIQSRGGEKSTTGGVRASRRDNQGTPEPRLQPPLQGFQRLNAEGALNFGDLAVYVGFIPPPLPPLEGVNRNPVKTELKEVSRAT
jgi:hypothetical protein